MTIRFQVILRDWINCSPTGQRGYGKRMEWQHIPGFGWQYVEVEYGPDNYSCLSLGMNNE